MIWANRNVELTTNTLTKYRPVCPETTNNVHHKYQRPSGFVSISHPRPNSRQELSGMDERGKIFKGAQQMAYKSEWFHFSDKYLQSKWKTSSPVPLLEFTSVLNANISDKSRG